MKTIRLILAAMTLLLAFSCEKEEEIIGGQFSHDYIYVYLGKGQELVNAHKYEYVIPAEGGDFTLPLVSHGLIGSLLLRKCDAISVSYTYEEPIPDELIFDYPNKFSTRYLQDVNIHAEPNTGNESRECKINMYSAYYLGLHGSAEITIRQNGR